MNCNSDKMEGSKSFSIDALLAKDTGLRKVSSPPSPAMSSPNPHSPDSHKSGSFRTPSPEMANRAGSPAVSSPGSSPTGMSHLPISSIHSGIIPRPGLLNVQHPVGAAITHGMFPGHGAMHPYNGLAHGLHHPGVPLVSGSAFHMPPDQAIKAAQMHGMPLEWLARTGMFLPRPMEYGGKFTINGFILISSV